MDTTLKSRKPERRRYARYRVDLKGSVGLHADELLGCAVVDISHGGMRVVCSKYFTPNTALVGGVSIPPPQNNRGAIRYGGVARHSRLVPSGMLMGIEFCVLAPSSKAMLRSLIEQARRGSN